MLIVLRESFMRFCLLTHWRCWRLFQLRSFHCTAWQAARIKRHVWIFGMRQLLLFLIPWRYDKYLFCFVSLAIAERKLFTCKSQIFLCVSSEQKESGRLICCCLESIFVQWSAGCQRTSLRMFSHHSRHLGQKSIVNLEAFHFSSYSIFAKHFQAPLFFVYQALKRCTTGKIKFCTNFLFSWCSDLDVVGGGIERKNRKRVNSAKHGQQWDHSHTSNASGKCWPRSIQRPLPFQVLLPEDQCRFQPLQVTLCKETKKWHECKRNLQLCTWREGKTMSWQEWQCLGRKLGQTFDQANILVRTSWVTLIGPI